MKPNEILKAVPTELYVHQCCPNRIVPQSPQLSSPNPSYSHHAYELSPLLIAAPASKSWEEAWWSLSFHMWQFCSTISSMGVHPGKTATKLRNKGRATMSKKPTCDFVIPGLRRSMSGETVMPRRRSWSPCTHLTN